MHKNIPMLNHIELLQYGDTETEYQESRDFIVQTCVKEIIHNEEEIEKIEKEIRKMLKKFDYKLETMIGIDYLTSASFIAEIGDIKRFSSADKLAKYAGIAPITYSSAEKERVFKNKFGNRQLYHLFHSLAGRNINKGRNKDRAVNDIFYNYYQKKLSEGKTTHQALICVMRRLCNIIYGLMKNRTSYIHPVLSNQKAE